MKRLERLVNEFNSLASKKRLSARVMINNEGLFLGREEQFQYGSYQCKLSNNLHEAEAIVSSYIKLICFEMGE